MADLEELRRLAWECAQRHGHDVCPITGSDLIDLLDHISAQTQTISDLTRALEIALEETARCHDCLNYAGVLDDLRAALSSARSEEK